jgi:hypothetical protein
MWEILSEQLVQRRNRTEIGYPVQKILDENHKFQVLPSIGTKSFCLAAKLFLVQ